MVSTEQDILVEIDHGKIALGALWMFSINQTTLRMGALMGAPDHLHLTVNYKAPLTGIGFNTGQIGKIERRNGVFNDFFP